MKYATFLTMAILGLLTFSMGSCQKPEALIEENLPEENYLVVNNNGLCGYEMHDLTAGRTNPTKVGELEIANDAQNLYIEITPTAIGYTSYKLFVGDCNIVRGDSSATPGIFQYPLQGTFYDDSALVTVPLNTLPECFCVVALLSQPRGDGGGAPGGTSGGDGNGLFVDYCKVACPDCNTDNIFGQGGWGSKPAGQNPGTFLHANFGTWFPNGVTLGCASGHTLYLGTAQNVTNFLPQGGTPRALTQSYVNPTTRITVLAGHLLTLTLNVASNPSLGNQIITHGDFAGLTVNAFLAQANNFFGGCIAGDASKYSSTLASISNQPSQTVSCD